MPSVVSDSSIDDDDCMIFPLTDIDDDNNNAYNGARKSVGICGTANHDSVSRHVGDGPWGKMRHDSSGGERPRAHGILARPLSLRLNIGQHQAIQDCSMSSSPKANWMQALRKIKHLKDPWEQFRIHSLPSETATRHRYHPLKKQWVVDKVELKMEREV